MRRPWTDHVIRLHPIIVSGVFLLLFVAPAPLVASEGSIGPIWAMSMAAMLAPLLLWHYSLHRSASARLAKKRRPIAFIITSIATAALLLIAGLPSLTAPLPTSGLAAVIMPLSTLGYFAAIWSAAAALMRVEEQNDAVPWHKTIGTFFLEFYLPIGIWFLHGRIRRLLAADPIPR